MFADANAPQDPPVLPPITSRPNTHKRVGTTSSASSSLLHNSSPVLAASSCPASCVGASLTPLFLVFPPPCHSPIVVAQAARMPWCPWCRPCLFFGPPTVSTTIHSMYLSEPANPSQPRFSSVCDRPITLLASRETFQAITHNQVALPIDSLAI
ncbi:hypothetical protein C8Q79DRAFT_51309 [Trametes meyenii]|nr:hypothetical protein C8Q79DRAFT_51309 [Trametes meyenii]